MKSRLSALAAVSLLAVAGSAFAATTSAVGDKSFDSYASDLGNPPLASGIATNAGLEWVYASPCQGTPSGCGGGDGGVLLHSGFHFASAAEWGTWGSLAAFQGALGAVTCSAPQFSITYDHCDYGDLAAGFVWASPLTDPVKAANTNAETFLVRAVPEPGTYALMFAGLGLVGWMARRRQQR